MNSQVGIATLRSNFLTQTDLSFARLTVLFSVGIIISLVGTGFLMCVEGDCPYAFCAKLKSAYTLHPHRSLSSLQRLSKTTYDRELTRNLLYLSTFIRS